MFRYFLKRLLLLVPVIIGVSILASSLIRIVPGDAVLAQLQSVPQRKDLEIMRQQLGLDKSYPEQYLNWMGGVVRADFGRSFVDDQPVLSRFGEALPVSLELAVIAALFALLPGITIGIISAVRQNKFVDYVARFISVGGLAIPSFWLGTLILVLPSIWFHWTPPMVFSPLLVDPLANLTQVVPAALTLGIGLSAVIMRFTRSSMLDVLHAPYISTARSKGLAGSAIVYRHALRNALIPVITVLGNQFGFLLGSTVIVETIFSLPGIGRLTYQSIIYRDYPQVQGNIMLIAIFFVLMNLATDLIYSALDPRVNLASKAAA